MIEPHLTFSSTIFLIIILVFTCTTISESRFLVQEMAKNAWGRFPERGKWQKIRGDDFPSAGNGKKCRY